MSLGQLKLSMSKTRLSHSAPSPHHDPTSLSFQIFRIPPFSLIQVGSHPFCLQDFFFLIFIYWAVLGLSCGRWTVSCGMWDLVP